MNQKSPQTISALAKECILAMKKALSIFSSRADKDAVNALEEFLKDKRETEAILKEFEKAVFSDSDVKKIKEEFVAYLTEFYARYEKQIKKRTAQTVFFNSTVSKESSEYVEKNSYSKLYVPAYSQIFLDWVIFLDDHDPKKLRIFSFDTREEIGVLQHNERVEEATSNRAGDYLIVLDKKGTIYVWCMRDRSLEKTENLSENTDKKAILRKYVQQYSVGEPEVVQTLCKIPDPCDQIPFSDKVNVQVTVKEGTQKPFEQSTEGGDPLPTSDKVLEFAYAKLAQEELPPFLTRDRSCVFILYWDVQPSLEGCDFYLSLSFPTDNFKAYKNSYTFAKKALRYITYEKREQNVVINDMGKFLNDIKPFKLTCPGKMHFSNDQVKKFITSNGGHTPVEEDYRNYLRKWDLQNNKCSIKKLPVRPNSILMPGGEKWEGLLKFEHFIVAPDNRYVIFYAFHAFNPYMANRYSVVLYDVEKHEIISYFFVNGVQDYFPNTYLFLLSNGHVALLSAKQGIQNGFLNHPTIQVIKFSQLLTKKEKEDLKEEKGNDNSDASVEEISQTLPSSSSSTSSFFDRTFGRLFSSQETVASSETELKLLPRGKKPQEEKDLIPKSTSSSATSHAVTVTATTTASTLTATTAALATTAATATTPIPAVFQQTPPQVVVHRVVPQASTATANEVNKRKN